MTDELCGVTSRNLVATDTKQTVTVDSLTIALRRLDTVWESCYYQIGVEADKWHDDA